MDDLTAKTGHELAQACANAMFARDEASNELGIELIAIEPGYASMSMPITPTMANGDGVCHGGFLFSLADTAMAFASNSRNEVYVAMNASIEFLAPGNVGETVTAVAREQHRAGRTSTYHVEVTDSQNNPIAQFLGRTYRIRGTVIDGPQRSAP